MPAPYMYDKVNLAESCFVPGALHTVDNATFSFYYRYLFQKAISQFKWELPEEWDLDYFLGVLYSSGYISVLDTPEFGVIPQYSTLSGYNLYYRPRKILVSNPLFPKTYERTIDEDCVVIHIMPDYKGVVDLVTIYAAKLATLACDVDINAINSRLAYVFAASNSAAAESFKKMFDKISSGDPAAYIDKELYNSDGEKNFQAFANNLRNNYLVTSHLDDMRTLENQFCTIIGIPTANTEKRARLNTDEVHANDTETAILANKWLESIKSGCDKVKAMFGVEIKVDWRVNPNDKYNVNTGAVQLEQ